MIWSSNLERVKWETRECIHLKSLSRKDISESCKLRKERESKEEQILNLMISATNFDNLKMIDLTRSLTWHLIIPKQNLHRLPRYIKEMLVDQQLSSAIQSYHPYKTGSTSKTYCQRKQIPDSHPT